jgi:hypothetical protein
MKTTRAASRPVKDNILNSIRYKKQGSETHAELLAVYVCSDMVVGIESHSSSHVRGISQVAHDRRSGLKPVCIHVCQMSICIDISVRVYVCKHVCMYVCISVP